MPAARGLDPDFLGGSWHYRIYGLRLSSNLELPGVVPADDGDIGPEVRVRLGAMPPVHPETSAEPYYVASFEDEPGVPHLSVNRCGGEERYHFRYGTGIEFVIDGPGGSVWGAWADNRGPEDAVLFLLGPVLGFLLRMRGITCLHAGAIAVNHVAGALVGPSGVGKSTLTTVLARLGFPVLTDDVLPVVREADRILALPGYPRLRLRPDVVERLYGHADARPRLTPGWDRRYLDLPAEGLGFQVEPARVGVLYVLDRGARTSAAPEIEPIGGHEALSLLLANTYRNELLPKAARRQELHFLADVVGRIPVRRIRMAPGLSEIERVVCGIVEDLRGLARA